MPAYTKGFTREIKLTAAEFGLNGVTVAGASSVVSNTIDATGYNQLRLDFTWTHVAYTAVSFFLEHSRDGGVTWERFQTSSVAAGTETLSDHLVQKTTAASVKFPYVLPIFYNWIRLTLSTTAGTTDTATVAPTLGVSG